MTQDNAAGAVAPQGGLPVGVPPADPDTKDWTWVLEQRCPECGFHASEVAAADVGPSIRALVPRWREALTRPDVRARPTPGTWSVLEYACHVRDVHRLFGERLSSIVEQDDPLFTNWDQDEAAIVGGYHAQDPEVVAEELAAAAEATAARFDALLPDQRQRPGRRSNGSVFTAATLGTYYLHDVVHHTYDVGA